MPYLVIIIILTFISLIGNYWIAYCDPSALENRITSTQNSIKLKEEKIEYREQLIITIDSLYKDKLHTTPHKWEIVVLQQEIVSLYETLFEINEEYKVCLQTLKNLEQADLDKEIKKTKQENEITKLLLLWNDNYSQNNYLEAISYYIEYLNHYPENEEVKNYIQISYTTLSETALQNNDYEKWKYYLIERLKRIVDNFVWYQTAWDWFIQLYLADLKEENYLKSKKYLKNAESSAFKNIEKDLAAKSLLHLEKIKTSQEENIKKWDYETLLWTEKHSQALKLFSKLSINIWKQIPSSQKTIYEELIKTLKTKQTKFSFEKKVISQMLIDWCNDKINSL